jgi:hypothetical protein
VTEREIPQLHQASFTEVNVAIESQGTDCLAIPMSDMPDNDIAQIKREIRANGGYH